jgi:hypothetical protein
MSNFTIALVIMLCINAVLFLGQAAVIDINPAGSIFFHCEGTSIGSLEANGCANNSMVLNDQSAAAQLPAGTSSVSPTTGNVFTDAPSSMKNWLIDTLGLGYLWNILSAPYSFLKAMMLPQPIVFVLGTLWYGISFFLVIAWIMGRYD